MNTSAVTAVSRQDELLPLLRLAVADLERGDVESFDRNIDALIQQRDKHLADGVARIARRLHQAIQNLDLDSRLSCMAGRDIPDARTHLDHVVRMTEEAAHRTLDIVESSRTLLNGMALDHDALIDRMQTRPRDSTQADVDDSIVGALEEKMAALRASLSSMTQAQEYQDLSGQMIRRVINLVQAVEKALMELLRATGEPLKFAADAPISGNPSVLRGPGAPGSAGQKDADALLADLGF